MVITISAVVPVGTIALKTAQDALLVTPVVCTVAAIPPMVALVNERPFSLAAVQTTRLDALAVPIDAAVAVKIAPALGGLKDVM
ncbi:MAG: hypothetical protein V4605_08510 [Pseudomonadota bacterium]